MAAEAIHPKTYVCKICATEFHGRRGPNIYCGEKCRRSVENSKRTAVRRAAGVKVLIGQPFACITCGIEVVARSPKARYCAECRNVARLGSYRRSNNRIQRKEHFRNKLKSDPKYALDRRIGWAVWDALKNDKAGRSWEDVLGFSLEELSLHLERQFVDGMSWLNMGKWHVDHILPRASFKYASEHDEAFKQCWSLSNLRPLWGRDNIVKGAKILPL
jgi:ribosomal protein L37AE/L43A